MKNLHAQRGGTLLGVMIGIVVGVLISFGVVWTMNKTPLPFRDKGVRAERPASGEGEQEARPAFCRFVELVREQVRERGPVLGADGVLDLRERGGE